MGALSPASARVSPLSAELGTIEPLGGERFAPAGPPGSNAERGLPLGRQPKAKNAATDGALEGMGRSERKRACVSQADAGRAKSLGKTLGMAAKAAFQPFHVKASSLS